MGREAGGTCAPQSWRGGCGARARAVCHIGKAPTRVLGLAMSNCLDDGTIQRLPDCELAAREVRRVVAHLGACESCAGAAREVRRESALLAGLFAAMREQAVPTERLWRRISNAVTSDLPTTRYGLP